MNVAQNIWLLAHKLWGNCVENSVTNFSITFSNGCYAICALHMTASDAPIALSIANDYDKKQFRILSENTLPNSYGKYFAIGV